MEAVPATQEGFPEPMSRKTYETSCRLTAS
jgi:hypothetical protein